MPGGEFSSIIKLQEVSFEQFGRKGRCHMSSIGNVSFSSLNHANNAVNNSIKKISTGSQHPNASYGASDYAITQRMQYNLGGYHQSVSNTQNTNSMLKTASGAVSNTLNSLSSLQEKLLNAANGTNGATLRHCRRMWSRPFPRSMRTQT